MKKKLDYEKALLKGVEKEINDFNEMGELQYDDDVKLMSCLQTLQSRLELNIETLIENIPMNELKEDEKE